MSRKKMNLIFMFIITGLITSFSIGYSALSQNLMISGDVSYYYNSKKLYDVLKNEVNRNTGYAREYTGEHQDSMAGVGSKKIYYWYGSNNNAGTAIQNKFNVIFANHCWQMIRTTDTGGVKMVYNGEPENNQCLNTRGNHVGYDSRTTQSMSTTYYYGTSYTYDKTNNVFSLDGTVTTGTIQPGQYTCKQTTSTGTCATLYLVDTLNSGTSYYVLPLNSSSHYSQFGNLQFNQSNSSPAYVGYMYNTVYPVTSKSNIFWVTSSSTIKTNYYYSDTIDYGNLHADNYTLTNPVLISTLSDYNTLVGKYMLNTTGTYATAAYYVTAVDGNKFYYRALNRGDLNTSLTLGDSYTKNGNTYTLLNPTNVSYIDWYNTSDYSIYKGKYVCDGNNTSCTNLRHIYGINNPTKNYFYYFDTNNTYSYAEDVTYSGGTYTLAGDIKTFWDLFDSTNKGYLSTHHYTCLENGTSCSTVGYAYDFSVDTIHYTQLSGVANVSAALNNMLNVDNVNQTNSTIKTGIDAWYKKYMTGYTSKLEDTIFCNDRSIKTLGGWNPNGGNITTSLQFKNYSTNGDLSCTNITDKFSLSNSKAQLTYPVGLLTSSETYLLNNSNIRKTEQDWWLISPDDFAIDYAYGYDIYTSGNIGGANVNDSDGVRPVISLVPGIKYSSGNGSMENPYIVSDSISNTTFIDSAITNGTRNVTINYPDGCGTSLTCKYKKNNETEVNVTTTSVVVPFTSAGIITTSITDDDDFVLTNSHSVKFNVLYVSSSGNDSTGFGTIADPYKTLKKAYNMSDDTATVYIMNNITQTETLNIRSNKNLTLTSCTKSGSTCPTSTANSIIRGSSLTSNLISQDNGTLNLSTITIDGNNVSADSPMIYIEGTINLESGTTLKNANTISDGGALYSDEGTVNINDATITSNSANKGGGLFSFAGEINLNSGTISSNTASTYGGGVSLVENGSITISGGTITANQANSGGAIYNNGGIVTINQGTDQTVSISYNSATGSGGAIYTNSGTINLTKGIINNNSGDYGGGVFVDSNSTSNINGMTISNNTSNYSGGGVYTYGSLSFTSGTISNNTANSYGGGIMCNGTCTISGGTIGGSSTTKNTSKGCGGGIFNYNTLIITGGNITYNESSNSGGGGVCSGNSGTVTLTSPGNISYNKALNGGGGGVFINSGTFTMNSGTLNNNTATVGGGGVWLTYSDNTVATMNLKGGTISNNSTSGTTGGGGIVVTNDTSNTALTTLNMSGGTIGSNSATHTSSGYGGGIIVGQKSKVVLSAGTISSNTSHHAGGGIMNSGTITMSGGSITGNTVTSTATNAYGGGIHNTSTGSFTMTAGTISNNNSKMTSSSASYSAVGGGISVQSSGTVKIAQASGKTITISGNKVTNSNSNQPSSGGGVWCSSPNCTMSGGTISSNTSKNGGGVYIEASGTFKLSGGVIKKNTASSSSGGIYKTTDGTYTRTGGYVCKNNSPTNSYDITDTSNTNCS